MKDQKARITITLRNSLLPQLDRFVDGERIRNRSHAIEYILSQHLGAGISRAVVLAGANEDGDEPVLVPMTRIGNKHVIDYTIEQIKAAGVREVTLIIDQYGAPLKEYVGDGAKWGVHITVVHDSNKSGTAAALRLAQPLIDSPFYLIYGDVMTDVTLSDIAEAHQETEAIGTIALTYKQSIDDYGVARMDGSTIVEYIEKPGPESRHGLVNSGIYLLEPEIFNYIDDTTRSVERDVLPSAAKSGQLHGYPFQSKWYDISSAGGRKRAEDTWG